MKKLEVIILKETEKAVLCTSPYVTENDSYKNPSGTQYSFWLPKSLIKITDELHKYSKLPIKICELPEWLLMKI